MKKIFSLFAAIALTSIANAEIYEADAEDNKNSIEVSVGDVDSKSRIPIYVNLNNEKENIVGVDVYLDFSAGNDKFKTTVTLSNRVKDEDEEATHSATKGISKNADEFEGLFYIGLNSSSLDVIQGTEGTIFTVYIDATSIEDGEYTLKVPYASAFNKADYYKCQPIDQYVFTVADGTVTGINAISTDAQSAKYYSVNGAIQNGPQKGVNIVKYANGEVKKVIVK